MEAVLELSQLEAGSYSIVQKLVDTLGGRIDVETEKGKGTCFTVYLPRAVGEA